MLWPESTCGHLPTTHGAAFCREVLWGGGGAQQTPFLPLGFVGSWNLRSTNGRSLSQDPESKCSFDWLTRLQVLIVNSESKRAHCPQPWNGRTRNALGARSVQLKTHLPPASTTRFWAPPTPPHLADSSSLKHLPPDSLSSSAWKTPPLAPPCPHLPPGPSRLQPSFPGLCFRVPSRFPCVLHSP